MTDISQNTMITVQPEYYDRFSCLADRCPDTCCQGWIIEIDPEILKQWQNISSGKNGDSWKAAAYPADCIDAIPQRNHTFRYQMRLNEQKKCPMLTADGLCSVVMHHGDEMTPRICRDYPRMKTEYEQFLQKYVSVRCAAVLNLLWEKSEFHYIFVGNEDADLQDSYPSRELLDGFLKFGNTANCSVSDLLLSFFTALYTMHKKLAAEMPCDASGLRDYGQEFLTSENIAEVLDTLNERQKNLSSRKVSYNLCVLSTNSSTFARTFSGNTITAAEQFFRPYHDYMYDVMQSFFDSPIFGPEFHELFQQSNDLLKSQDPEVVHFFLDGEYLPDDFEHKFRLLILEELFTAVCSVEVQDYESILVRMQWLIVQYLVVRYILFLDFMNGKEITVECLKNHISRIFRVTDLPDILKISFFDFGFKNWLWEPAWVEKLLKNH